MICVQAPPLTFDAQGCFTEGSVVDIGHHACLLAVYKCMVVRGTKPTDRIDSSVLIASLQQESTAGRQESTGGKDASSCLAQLNRVASGEWQGADLAAQGLMLGWSLLKLRHAQSWQS